MGMIGDENWIKNIRQDWYNGDIYSRKKQYDQEEQFYDGESHGESRYEYKQEYHQEIHHINKEKRLKLHDFIENKPQKDEINVTVEELKPLYRIQTVQMNIYTNDLNLLEDHVKQREKEIYLGTYLYQFHVISDIDKYMQLHDCYDNCKPVYETIILCDFTVMDLQIGKYVLGKKINSSFPDLQNYKNGQLYIVSEQTPYQMPYYENLYLLKIKQIDYIEGSTAFVAFAEIQDFEQQEKILMGKDEKVVIQKFFRQE